MGMRLRAMRAASAWLRKIVEKDAESGRGGPALVPIS
jgi:hypothetical protein